VNRRPGACIPGDPKGVCTGRALFGLQRRKADDARTPIIEYLRPEHAAHACGEALGKADAVPAQMEAFIGRLEFPVSEDRGKLVCRRIFSTGVND
jgi:hypothetical protein